MIVAAGFLGATFGATAAQAQHDHQTDHQLRPVTLDAGRDRAAYQAAKQRVPVAARFGYKPAAAVFLVSDAVLEARIAAGAIILTALSGHGKRRSQPRTLSATMNLRTGTTPPATRGRTLMWNSNSQIFR